MSMTRDEMIAKISEMAEENDPVVVGYYLDNAAEIILNQLYPYDENWDTEEELAVPNRYLNLQIRITVGLLAKRGAEFEAAHSENGVSRHYTASDVPDDVLREIVPKAVTF